jgi:AraC-like DNA-binding protein
MDALSAVLRTLYLRGRVYCRTELGPPWGMELPPGQKAYFHVVIRGSCRLRLGQSDVVIDLRPGDLALLPHGTGHRLLDGQGSAAVPLERFWREGPASHGSRVLRLGDGPVETELICGAFELEQAEDHPLIGLLPQYILAPGESGRTAPWLSATLQQLANEMIGARPGAEILIARLLDVILIQTVRVWLETQPIGRPSWLGALRDPDLGVVLGLMHEAPDRPWTVATLAAEAAMSRSVFAQRFKALVGEAPLVYLTKWRLSVAAQWLRTERSSLTELAARAGYRSEAAFSRAFKRRFGMSPLRYRQQL